MRTEQPLNLFDYEALAEARLPAPVWDFFADGAGDRITLAENRRAFDRIAIRPRMLVDVSRVDISAKVLGSAVEAPILIAPCGPQGAAHPHGELATVDGAGRAGVVMVAASGASRTIEAIASAASGPLWMQLYLFPERPRSEALVRRAEAGGCGAIMLTVDAPRAGRKERTLRSQDDFDWPAVANLAGLPPPSVDPLPGAPATWADVDWLCSITDLPVILKGLLTAEDAALAVEHGVAGVVVSNHGGRQLDGVLASIDALPEITAAIGGRCEVYLDGGVRRGTDVLKALALGARAVMIGRPALWGLAVGGANGVFDVVEMLKNELATAMALSGRPTLASIDGNLLAALRP
jgi:isopentenyl diphosphate isomerase/L-lactate dehydrogenase-like FMN-dependent dehydrogenase